MSPNAAPLTAIERARVAYELLKRRQHAAALQQRARERSRNIKLAVAAASLAALLLGVTIHNGWTPTLQRSSAMVPRTDNSKFGETRTAQVRSFIKGNTCQEKQFNNDIGAYVGGSFVPCEPESKRQPFAGPLLPKGARLNSIRDGFTTR